ncbi:hypothetical protein F506_00595 [Herbaspirillum hiltneri N3]|uniref:Uncharacterized protein n=1 Tax=Herbaspirillum hiltneri N3 TaxID=1262470 RepID=A0ABM5UW47_9BURK|nr:hypothetical protein F506_00595 [Herbaspirillum hiltneri N3]
MLAVLQYGCASRTDLEPLAMLLNEFRAGDFLVERLAVFTNFIHAGRIGFASQCELLIARSTLPILS